MPSRDFATWALIQQAAAREGIDPRDIEALIAQESSGNALAQGPAIPKAGGARAQGLMQLMPETARDLGVTDPFDPTQNINAGTKYYAQLLKRYGGDKARARAAYNWGLGNVDRQGLDRMPAETRNYVRQVDQKAAAMAPADDLDQFLLTNATPTTKTGGDDLDALVAQATPVAKPSAAPSLPPSQKTRRPAAAEDFYKPNVFQQPLVDSLQQAVPGVVKSVGKAALGLGQMLSTNPAELAQQDVATRAVLAHKARTAPSMIERGAYTVGSFAPILGPLVMSAVESIGTGDPEQMGEGLTEAAGVGLMAAPGGARVARSVPVRKAATIALDVAPFFGKARQAGLLRRIGDALDGGAAAPPAKPPAPPKPPKEPKPSPAPKPTKEPPPPNNPTPAVRTGTGMTPGTVALPADAQAVLLAELQRRAGAPPEAPPTTGTGMGTSGFGNIDPLAALQQELTNRMPVHEPAPAAPPTTGTGMAPGAVPGAGGTPTGFRGAYAQKPSQPAQAPSTTGTGMTPGAGATGGGTPAGFQGSYPAPPPPAPVAPPPTAPAPTGTGASTAPPPAGVDLSQLFLREIAQRAADLPPTPAKAATPAKATPTAPPAAAATPTSRPAFDPLETDANVFPKAKSAANLRPGNVPGVIESPVEIARQLQDAVGKLDLKGAQNKTLREMLKGSIERGAQDSRAMLNLINKLVRQGAPSSEIVAKLVDDYNQRVNIHLREK